MNGFSILGLPPKAILIPVLPAYLRVNQEYKFEDRFSKEEGFYQVVIHKKSGKEWNVGREYDHEGYVDRFNVEVERGMFNPN